ncbi:MAG TPA: tetratricopeptide repeat protein [Solirubrobacteraceae bacterium]|jgi:tetratricopeptide (TPR) repeat protein|nr:tetratricopeptide repeat protein [Solirubrobacteraceae bacterium]
METLKAFRVFIASPSGLDEERRLFRTTLQVFNEDDANERGAAFLPIGWETTIGGVGRPKDLINQDVRRSDYCVVVLWDRWGSATGSGEYTAGTEEEYNLAIECLQDGDSPMRDVLVLFKGVDERQRSDPGEQLRKVLAFRRALEASKSLLFFTFDTPDEFRRLIQRTLQGWLRDGDEGREARRFESPLPRPGADVETESSDDASSSGQDVLERAQQLSRAGRDSEAESLLASAVVAGADAAVLQQYAKFLRRAGRFAHADEMSQRLLNLGEAKGDDKAVVDAHANLALSSRRQGRLATAERHLQQAIERASGSDAVDARMLAYLLDNLGLVFRRKGDLRGAGEMHRSAIAARGEEDAEGNAHSYNHLGFIAKESGDLADAMTFHTKALEGFKLTEDRGGTASAQANLGAIYELRGDYEAAEASYRMSLKQNEDIPSATGIGMNYAQLARVKLAQGNLADARELADRCLEINERSGDQEGIAAALNIVGRIDLESGALMDAEEALGRALAIYEDIGHGTGAVSTLTFLVKLAARQGDKRAAGALLAKAESEGKGLQQAWVLEQIRSASEELGVAAS